MIEQLHSPATAEQAGTIYQLDPAGYSKLVLARAGERLAGRTPTPLPDAAKVTASRLEEMLKQLADAKPEKVHGVSQGWSIEEKLAYHKWLEEPENLAKLPASVTAARKLLTAPVETAGNPQVARAKEIMRTLKLEPGTAINFETLTNLAATLASEAKIHSGLSLGFTETPLNTGNGFMADSAFDGSPSGAGGYSRYFLSQAQSALTDSTSEAAVSVSIPSLDGRQVPVIWTVSEGKTLPPDAAALAKLREVLATLDQPEVKLPSIFLCVLHRDDLEKLAKLGQSEDSESSDE